jgi:hypothetical protein
MTTVQEIIQHGQDEEARERWENTPKKISVVGLNYYGGVTKGEILELVPEPLNEHDKHAIYARNIKGEKVGYVKKGNSHGKIMWNRDIYHYSKYFGHKIMAKVITVRRTHCVLEVVEICPERPNIDWGFEEEVVEEKVEEVVEEVDFIDENIDEMIKFFKDSPAMVAILAKRL